MNKTSSQFLYTSSAKASLFDIVAEESLRSSLKPAWEYFCKVLNSKYPRHVSKLCDYSDEIFYTALFMMEEYSLRKKSASITESFYELTRESSSSNSSMLRKAKWISIISVVVVPYVLTKLEKHYDKVREQILCNDPTVTSFNRQFYKLYPVLLTISKWIRILNYILYLFNYTHHAFPMLHLTRMQLKYAGTNMSSNSDEPISEQSNVVIRMLRRLTDTLLSIISKMAPVMFYSLQFMETFFQEDGGTQKSSNVTVAESPSMPKVVSAEIKLPSSRKQCPLCRQVHVNPSTTAISGFVFCYTCLYKYIDKFACCPITYRPCDVSDIIRLHP